MISAANLLETHSNKSEEIQQSVTICLSGLLKKVALANSRNPI